MKFYFDESGSFTIKPVDEHLAVVVGVAVPHSDAARLKSEFSALRDTVTRRRGKGIQELKGAKWNDEERMSFCELLERFPRILVRPTIVDIRHFRGGAVTAEREQLALALKTIADTITEERFQLEFAHLSEWQRDLSDVQLVRLYAWASCVDWTLRDAAMELVPPEEHDAWRQLEVVIDGRPALANIPEGRFFKLMLLNWTVGWAHLRPIGTVAVNGSTHPLNAHFDLDGGLHTDRMFERIRFGYSHTEPELQIADVAAAIVRSAFDTRGTDRDALVAYGWLMKRASDRCRHGIGLTTAFQHETERSADEYSLLIREYDLAQVRRVIASGLAASLITWPGSGYVPAVMPR